MATHVSHQTLFEPRPLTANASTWFIATGLAFVLLGVIAIAAPVVAGMTEAVGWLLIAGGVLHGVKAMSDEGVERAAWQATAGTFYVIAGLYFLAHPLMLLGTLAAVLATVFLAEAVMDLMAGVATLKDDGVAWPLAEAVITGLLGLMLLVQWPAVSAWSLALIVGVNLMVDGASQLLLGVSWKRRMR